MNSKLDSTRQTTGGADIAKYAVAVLLAVAGVFAFYWFEAQWASSLRMLVAVGGVVAGIVVFLTTAKGLELREFFSETRFELRKVVWPTRQEAMRMTWIVIIAVTIIALILAGFDKIIEWLLRVFLG